MRHRPLTVAVVATTVVAVAAACSTSEVSGTPMTRAGNPAGTVANSGLPAGTPHVANPLDTSQAQSAPCGVLTSTQIASLDVVAVGAPSDSASGPACDWSDTSSVPSKMTFAVGFVTRSHGGLGSLYVQADSLRKNGGYFEPITPIQGYPAVLYAQFDDRREPVRAGCNLAIGVSDTLQFTVGIDITVSPRQSDACAIDEKVADMVMTTLRAGSG